MLIFPTPDGSHVDADGELIEVSLGRFERNFCEGTCCFNCGRLPIQVPIVQHPVVPEWIIRLLGLADRDLNLPDGAKRKYGAYSLPCCIDCVAGLAINLETPLEAAVSDGIDGLGLLLAEKGPDFVFQYLASTGIRLWLKARQDGSDTIAGQGREVAALGLATAHHLHAVARAWYSGVQLAKGVRGTLWVMEIDDDEGNDAFDLVDLPLASTLYMRVGTVAMFSVFDDAGACGLALGNIPDQLDGVITPPQARELAIELALARLSFKNPPRFRIDFSGDRPIMVADKQGTVPDFAPRDSGIAGELKVAHLAPYFEYVTGGLGVDELAALARQDLLSFLRDDDGNFIR